ncbi:T9SS type A sorting domain-containing protein [Marinoscillum pacificum]|uniref:T9SS type A sorting domain-containing protein n=1 Tax=Marinoscillum pacificum TaxID=392723 RepID=UPI0021584C6F|nr:T9SS type A sorting domain-containing protein [Marinoscillum pacificum]
MILASFFFLTKAFSQISLPYYQNFDGVAEISYTTDTDTLNEINEWGFAAARDDSERLGGLLMIGSTNGFQGSQSVNLSRNTDHNNSQYVTNSAVLTLDLSGYDANTTDIFLDFSFTRGNLSYSNSNNVRIKGSPSENNIVIYDWDANLPNYLEWKNVKRLNLSQALRNAGQNFSDSTQIRFVERSYSNTHAFYFDEVTIYERPINDVRVTEIDLPSASGSLTSAEELSVSIINDGTSDLTSVPLTIKVEGPGVTETISETASMSAISTSETYTYTFSHLFDLSEPGTYDVTAYSSLAGDTSYFNDTIFSVTYKYSTYSAGLPYSEDFESNNGGFIGYGNNSSWEYGDLSDGSKGWVTNASGNYNNSEYSYLLSPIFDLSAETSDPYIGFDIDFNTESCCDEFWLEVSLDGGITFSKVVSPQLQYTSNENYWNGVGSLSFSEMLITGTGGNSEVMLRIAFDSDGSVINPGIEVDNFTITSKPANDVSLEAIGLPQASTELSSTESISLDVVNLGTGGQSSVPISIVFTSPSGVQTYSENTPAISSGDTITYTFSQQFDFSEVGNYSVTAYTSLATDTYNELDTIRNQRSYHQGKYEGDLPLFYSFNAENDTIIYDGTAFFGTEDLIGVSYLSEGINGQLRVNSTYAEDGKSLILSRSEYSNQGTLNQLLISADLSSYSASSDKVLFDYNVRTYYEGTSSAGVYVRGSESDPWVLLHQWDRNYSANSVWQKYQSLDISAVLVANSQDFSSTSQIKVQSIGNSEYPYDYVSFDNIRIYSEPVNELQLLNIVVSEGPFYSSSESLQVEVINNGTATQTSIPISFNIEGPNGSSTFNEVLVGSLAEGDTTLLDIAESIDFSVPGAYSITGALGLSGDEWLENDTLTVTVGSYSKYTGELPYYLTLEGLADTTYAPGQYTMDGLDGISFEGSTSKSRLSILDANYYYGTGSQALKFDRRDYSYSSNEMVLSLDLSDLDDTQDRLLLDFQVYSYSADDYDVNKIYVRGNTDDDWLVVYDWFDTTSYYSNKWISIRELPLFDTLQANGQTYSSETQIKFSEYGYGTSSVLFDNIKVYLQYDTDLAIVSSDLEGKSAGLSESQQFKVDIFNNSVSDLTGYTINATIDGPSGLQNLSEVFDVTIPAQDTMSIQFSEPIDFGDFGDYSVSMSVSITEDGDPTNDELNLDLYRISRYTGEFPYFEDFESAAEATYGITPSTELTGFSFTTTDPNGIFRIVDSLTNSNKSKVGFLSRGYTDVLATNSLIFSADLSAYINREMMLDYDLSQSWMSYRNSDNGIYVRGNENESWVLLHDWNSNRPSHLTWSSFTGLNITEVLIENGQTISETFQMKFQDFEVDSGNGYIIDNLKLYPKLEQDAELLAMDIVQIEGAEGERVSLDIYNNGTEEIVSVPVTFVATNGSVSQDVTELASINIGRGDTVTYVFDADLDFSTGGYYIIEAFVALPGDIYNDGDTTSISLYKDFRFNEEIPILVDFEQDSANFRTYGSNSSWTYDSLENGTKGWLTKVDGNAGYGNYERSYLQFPTLDLSSYNQGIFFEFDLSVNLEESYDFAWLEMSLDGETFDKIDSEELHYQAGSTSWNGNQDIQVRSLYIPESFGNSQVIFRLALSTDGSVNREGLQFDNFVVRGPLDRDLAFLMLEGESMTPDFGEAEYLSIKLVNEGTQMIESADLVLNIVNPAGDTIQLEETSTINLGSYDTLSYQFASSLDLSDVGDYYVWGYVSTTGEQNSQNDSISSWLYHQNSIDELPFVLDLNGVYITRQRVSTALIEGLDGFSFESGASGELTISNYNSEHKHSLYLYNRSSLDNVSKAFLTMDLSTMSTSSNVLMMDLQYLNSDPDEINGLYVRGSHDQEWILAVSSESLSSFTWSDLRVNLTALLKQHNQEYSATTQIMVFNSGRWNQTYIDNFSIYERSSHDLELISVSIPESGFVIQSNESIQAVVRNNGITTVNSVPLRLRILGPSGVNQSESSSNVTLATDEIDTFSINSTNTFVEEGTYQITVSTELTADTVSENNSLLAYVAHQSIYSGSLPYYENFTSLTDSVYDHSRGKLGAIGGLSFNAVPNVGRLTVDEDSHSIRMWRSDYTNSSSTNNLLLSMDLSAYSTSDPIQLDFKFKGYDYYDISRYVEVRGDTSQAWLRLYDWVENASSSNFIEAKYLAIADTLAAHGQQFGTMTQVRFTQGADCSGCFFELSSIEVYEAPEVDLAIEVLEPIAASIHHENSQIKIVLMNEGQNTISSLPLYATAFAEDGSSQTIDFNATLDLAPLTTDTVVFDSFFDLPNPGNYTVKVYFDLANDERHYNDTLSRTMIVRSTYSSELPMMLTFDDHVSQVGSKESYQFADFVGLSYELSGKIDLSVESPSSGDGKVLKLKQTSDSDRSATADLVFTLDLSEYDTLTDVIKLRFDALERNDYPSVSLWIRSNESLDWIRYSYIYSGSYMIDIQSELKRMKQQYSDQVQIRLFFEGGGYSNASISFDNIYLFNTADNLAPQTLAFVEDPLPLYEDTDSIQYVGRVIGEDIDEYFTLKYNIYYNVYEDSQNNSSFYMRSDSLFMYQNRSYEADSVLNINIRVIDTEGAYLDQPFEFTLIDLNDSLSGLGLSKYWVNENNTDTVVVAVLQPVDEDLNDIYAYEFIDDELGLDNEMFIVENDELMIIHPNYETEKHFFDLHLRVTEASGDTASLATTIEIYDVNEPPISMDIILEEIDEDVEYGSLVATFSATDEDPGDDTFIYRFERDSFYVVDNQLFTGVYFDIDEELHLPLSVIAEDEWGARSEFDFEVIIIDLVELGIEDENIVVYPNPTMNELHVENKRITKLEAFDLTGVKMIETVKDRVINTRNWNSGVYILRIWVGEESKDVKIIKK